jgi:hypothetical protein
MKTIANVGSKFAVVFAALTFNSHSRTTYALASPSAAVLVDHSAAAVGLFNNMRVPAALIAGSIVPIGILSAPKVEAKDPKIVKLVKKANILLAGISLLNEILAVTYSSIAINKLVEISSPATSGVAELIAQTHLLAWIGTNVHFLLGLMGFALVAGSKAYFSGFGTAIGKAYMGWSIAVFLQSVSIINRGIGLGTMEESARFASNLFTLVLRYLKLLIASAKGGIFASSALLVGVYSTFLTFQALFGSEKE